MISPYLENESKRLGLDPEGERSSRGTSHDALYIPIEKSPSPFFPWKDLVQALILIGLMCLAIPAVEVIITMMK
jgi:hypothetical protein